MRRLSARGGSGVRLSQESDSFVPRRVVHIQRFKDAVLLPRTAAAGLQIILDPRRGKLGLERQIPAEQVCFQFSIAFDRDAYQFSGGSQLFATLNTLE